MAGIIRWLQIESRLSQNVRVEWEFFYVHSEWRYQGLWILDVKRLSLRWQNTKMADIIKLSEPEWVMSQIQLVSVRVVCTLAEFKLADFMMDAIMSLSQIELVWVRVRLEWECFWVNLREDSKLSESKMAGAESKMAEFKMAAIIKLSQNEWVKFFYVQMVGTNLGKCEWVWEEILRWLNPRWQNSWWQKFKMADCHQVESEWMSFWVRLN